MPKGGSDVIFQIREDIYKCGLRTNAGIRQMSSHNSIVNDPLSHSYKLGFTCDLTAKKGEDKKKFCI